MPILTTKTLIKLVRAFAIRHPQDFGWQEVAKFPDKYLEEIIREADCTDIIDALCAAEQVAIAFNND